MDPSPLYESPAIRMRLTTKIYHWAVPGHGFFSGITYQEYSIFKQGGEGAGIEEILDRHADLKVARSIYRNGVEQYPGWLIMLCDHARVLARSDRPETMPR